MPRFQKVASAICCPSSYSIFSDALTYFLFTRARVCKTRQRYNGITMQELIVPDTPANRALHAAVRKSDLAAVRRAFAQGASPKTLGQALCIALDARQWEVAEDLLRRGAYVNGKGREGSRRCFYSSLRRQKRRCTVWTRFWHESPILGQPSPRKWTGKAETRWPMPATTSSQRSWRGSRRRA